MYYVEPWPWLVYAVEKAQGDTASGSWELRDAEAEQGPPGVGGGGMGVRVGARAKHRSCWMLPSLNCL